MITPPLKGPHKGDRWVLLAGYLLFAGCGVGVGVLGIGGRLGDALGYIYLGWAAFMAVGGLTAASGQVFGRWFGELVGIPAMITALVFISLVLFVLAWVEGRFTGGAALGLLLLAFCVFLLRRHMEVRRDSQEDADRHARGG